jgi:serine/threonine protein kinase
VPRLKSLLRCVGEAVLSKGLKALCGLVPLGEFAYEVATDTFERLRKTVPKDERPALIAAAAQADMAEARQEAEAAVRDIPAVNALPLAERLNLVTILSQVPSAVRQSLKRPADPAGKTVPPSFALERAEQLIPMLPARLPRFKPGDRPQGIGNWVLVDLLGVGGFGEVWKAQHPSLVGIPPVALKFCLDPSTAAALRHEATLLDRVMQQAALPGIVTLRQAYLENDPLCLEYEYVSGGDLTALVRDWRTLAVEDRLRRSLKVLHHLAGTVAHFHSFSPPIVHRDLKPANVLVERKAGGRYALRIADFGIGGVAARRNLAQAACAASGMGALPTRLRGSHSPLYAPQRQKRGEPPDPRDDVFALGVLWYQLMMGDVAREVGPTYREDLFDEGVAPEWIDVLARCFADKPHRWLATAADLVERLSPLLAVGPPAEPKQPRSVGAGAERAALPLPVPCQPSQVQIPVPGAWYWRPEKEDGAECARVSLKWMNPPRDEQEPWVKAQDLPGAVHLEPNFGYRLRVAKTATDDDLAGLVPLRVLDSLRELTLFQCHQVTDAGLAYLQSLTSLESLVLWCEQLTDAGLAHLRSLTNLNALSVWGGERVTDAGLAHLRPLTALRALVIPVHLTDAGLVHLKSLTALHSLSLPSQVTDNGLALLRGFPRLEELDLANCNNVTEAGFAHLGSLTSLRCLDVANEEGDPSILTDRGLAHLRSLTALEELRVGQCSNQLTDAGLVHLISLTSLRRLLLSPREEVTGAGLSALGSLSKLEELSMGSEHLTDADLTYLRSLTALRTLYLYGDQLTGSCLAYLGSPESLEKVWLNNCPGLTDEGLARTPPLPSLQVLDLAGADELTGAGLAPLRHMTRLRKLDLGGCRGLTDAGLAHLRSLTALQTLNLHWCEELTDSGLAYLGGLRVLEELDLGMCDQITDAGLSHLRSLTSLRELYLNGCEQVTPAGIRSLQQALPGCTIAHSDKASVKWSPNWSSKYRG